MKQTVDVDCQMSCQSEKHKIYRKFLFINSQQKCFLVSVRLKSSLAHYRLDCLFVFCCCCFLSLRHFNGYLMAYDVFVIVIVSNTVDLLRTNFMTSYGQVDRCLRSKTARFVYAPNFEIEGAYWFGLVRLRPSVCVAGLVYPLRLHTVKIG